MKNLELDKRHTLTLVLFATYLLALIWLILFKLQFSIPDTSGGRIVNFIPLLGSFGENGTIRFAEIRANILAFIPFGIYICMLETKRSFVKKTFVIAGSALAFEVVQFIFAIGRADITDLLSNTLGGLIGVGIYALLSKALRGRTNKVLNVIAAIFTVLAVFLVSLLLISHRWVTIRTN